MEAIKLNTNKNIIDAYATKPDLFYDLEGLLAEKDGKNIRLDVSVENKNVSYLLKLREDIQSKLGEWVEVDKENIVSAKIQEKTKEESIIREDKIIEELGLGDSEEIKATINYLLDNHIPITRENIESFYRSRQYLQEIIDGIDFDSCVQLIDMDMDLKEESLQNIAEALVKMKEADGNLSIKEILGLDRKLNYKEAEKIAKEIYGRLMGKDIYDSIIALHRVGIPVNRKNIEKVTEVMNKLHGLRDYEGELLVDIFKEDLAINIETLYRHKYSYDKDKLDLNISSSIYDKFMVEKEGTIEELIAILEAMGISPEEENIELLREFLISGVDVSKENFETILDMKDSLDELIKLLNENSMARLIDEGIDPLREDIRELVARLKDVSRDRDARVSEEAVQALEELEGYTNISNRQLLSLIKNGNDFKLTTLREIAHTNIQLDERIDPRVAEKTITISNIFNRLEDLSSNTIAFASRKYINITLENLYNSEIHLEVEGSKGIQPIDQAEENFIRQEYLNIKNNINISLIEKGFRQGIELEQLPLDELNQYVRRSSSNRYREVENLVNEIKALKGKENSILPKLIQNDIPMSLGQLIDVDAILSHGSGIGHILNSSGIREKVPALESKVKDLSLSLKEARDGIGEDYKKLLGELKDLTNSPNSDREKEKEEIEKIQEYLTLQNKLSKEDLVLQIPILTEQGYNNVNLIVPNISQGIDKDDMTFYFNLKTEMLGNMKFNLQVRGEEINMFFEGDKGDVFLKNKDLLEEGFNRIGYKLGQIAINNSR